MDRFQELNAFVAVVEAGGFSAAARRIGESQSVVSKAIGALEKRLGVQLFHRSTRVVTLTEPGRRFHESMKPLLDGIARSEQEVMNSTHEVAGPVRIAASATFGRLHVLPLLPPLLASHPKLVLDVQLTDRVQDLLADSVDLAIRVSPVHSLDAVVKRVSTTSVVCAGSRRYFEAHGTPAVPDDLKRHNCIVYDGMDQWRFDGPSGRFDVRVSGNLASNTVETILSAVRDGIGIGLFFRASLVGDMASPEIVTVLDDFIGDTRDVSLIWPSRRYVPARVRRVTDFFEAALAERL